MFSVYVSRLYAAAIPPIPPDPNGVPGGTQAMGILGGLEFFAMLGLFLALIAGAATWYGGSKAQNSGVAGGGRAAVIGAILGIIVLGAGIAVLNWGFGIGQSVTA